MTVNTKRRNKRYVSVRTDPGYTGGVVPMADAEPEQPALTADAPYRGYLQWLANDWTIATDERLETMNADLYDLGDRMNQLIIMVCTGMIVIIVGVAALIAMATT